MKAVHALGLSLCNSARHEESSKQIGFVTVLDDQYFICTYTFLQIEELFSEDMESTSQTTPSANSSITGKEYKLYLIQVCP
jgi:hypothetical protein